MSPRRVAALTRTRSGRPIASKGMRTRIDARLAPHLDGVSGQRPRLVGDPMAHLTDLDVQLGHGGERPLGPVAEAVKAERHLRRQRARQAHREFQMLANQPHQVDSTPTKRATFLLFQLLGRLQCGRGGIRSQGEFGCVNARQPHGGEIAVELVGPHEGVQVRATIAILRLVGLERNLFAAHLVAAQAQEVPGAAPAELLGRSDGCAFGQATRTGPARVVDEEGCTCGRSSSARPQRAIRVKR